MKVILGHKIGMTQRWDDRSRLIAATIVEAQPNTVVEKTDSQTTLAVASKSKIRKPQAKLASSLKAENGLWLRTIKGTAEDKATDLTVAQFKIGERVSITAVSKGKGYAGVMKRHGFAGWPQTHGHSHQRRPGSIGAQQPQRVPKGKKMAGRMGHQQVTIRGARILEVDNNRNLLVISGPIPGPARSRVLIKTSNA